MNTITELTHEEAKKYFLNRKSYFNADLPPYISFEPILTDVAAVLNGRTYDEFKSKNPSTCSSVNYNILTNKDGKLAWRTLELIHPAIYVSLVNVICDPDNWTTIKKRLSAFEGGAVECCSIPVMSQDNQKDAATQVKNWWHRVEQRSLCYSLEFSHILHTDVTDCYGSLYTHSVSWAIHGRPEAKEKKRDGSLLGNKIDSHIQAGRYGQTNGISQGSVLMDFVAELVLGFVDEQINLTLGDPTDYRILRYRDDYRIFANSDDKVEEILKVVSEKLWLVGMRLGVSKTRVDRNVVEGSIKPDKLAGIDLQDLGDANAETIQKQLLRLHAFGQRFPNSGALRRLVSEFYDKIIYKQIDKPNDLEEQVAIATDIGFVSPATFPAVAGILSYLISLAPPEEKPQLWTKVRKKMARVPYNGYLEIWLQRVVQPKTIDFLYNSEEQICKIVKNKSGDLWGNRWITHPDLLVALNPSKILIKDPSEISEVLAPEEIELFRQNAWAY